MSAPKRALGALLDQAASSLQNFAILFAGLHWFDLAKLGSFSLLYAVMTLVVVVTRALTLEPLVVQYAGRATTAGHRALGGSLIVSLGIGVVLCVASLFVDGEHMPMVLAAAAAGPVLLVQDGYRYVLFANGRQLAAAANDACCLVITTIAVGAMWVTEWHWPASLMLAWGLGAAGGIGAGYFQTRCRPALSAGWRWLVQQKSLGVPLAGSQVAQQGTGRLSQGLISWIGGAAALGMIGASRTLVTPLTTLITASMSYSLPEAARARRSTGRSGLNKIVLLTSAALGLAVFVYAAILLVLPSDFGRVLAGDNWATARSLVVPTSLWVLGTAASQGPRVGLRVLEKGKETFRVSVLMGILLLVGTVTGVTLAGGVGAAWGFGLVSVIGQLFWWSTYWSAQARVA